MPPTRFRFTADLALLAIVAAWGYTFVPIKEVTASWPRHTMTFVALRFWIAVAAFAPLLLWQRTRPDQRRAPSANSLTAGAITGLAMLAGYGFQTAGLAFTSAAIAGFITGLSVVLVPIGARLLGKTIPGAAIVGMVIATFGLSVLSFQGAPQQDGSSFAFGTGELLVLCCAVAFAGQILLTDHFAARIDPIRFTAAQCLVTAIGASAYAFAFEIAPHGWPTLTGHIWYTAIFCGIICTTISFLVQTVAQRVIPATHVALIYATEPVFAALFARLLPPHELLTRSMQLGCGLILLGMLCAEFGPRLRKR